MSNGFIQESLTAIRAIKAFVRGDFQAKRFSDVNAELADASRSTFCRGGAQPAGLSAGDVHRYRPYFVERRAHDSGGGACPWGI